MSKQLPRLRRGLDMFPSPVPERPGFVLRDPFRYSDEVLIIPPLLAAGLSLYDGESTVLDVQAHLTRLIGQLVPNEIIESMTEVMQRNGFLETEELERLRAKKHAEFAAAPLRLPAHSGSGYPDQTAELRTQLDEYLKNNLSPAGRSDHRFGCAARQPVRRLAILRSRLRKIERRCEKSRSGNDRHRAGNFSLRTAGKVRFDAQTLRHAAGHA